MRAHTVYGTKVCCGKEFSLAVGSEAYGAVVARAGRMEQVACRDCRKVDAGKLAKAVSDLTRQSIIGR